METRRIISITLEQAREWYNKGNATLRELALSAYTKDELELDYNSIDREVDQICTCVCIPKCEGKKFQVLAKLATIAKFYNKDWKRTAYNTGYFISNLNPGNGPIDNYYKGISVYKHESVYSAGIVYFKNSEDALKALKILGDEVKELFK